MAFVSYGYPYDVKALPGGGRGIVNRGRVMKQRLLSICMALCLCLTLLPGAAWAAPAQRGGGSREAEATLEQIVRADEDDPALLTWTITYTPGQSTGMTGFEIRATLDPKLTPAFTVADGNVTGVTVKRGGDEIAGAAVTYDSATRTLTISNMGESEENRSQPITITYSTTVPDKYLLPESGRDPAAGDSGSSMGGTFTNTAQLWGKEGGEGLSNTLAFLPRWPTS